MKITYWASSRFCQIFLRLTLLCLLLTLGCTLYKKVSVLRKENSSPSHQAFNNWIPWQLSLVFFLQKNSVA